MDLKEIVDEIKGAPTIDGMTTKVVAIDGCGGAGKSALAAKLAKLLGNCAIVSTDDFASWEDLQNGYPRLLEQVLQPLQKNRPAKYQRYDWDKSALSEWVTVPPQKYVILEGLTAAREEFREFLSFSIFVKADREARLQRVLQRDGQEAKEQWLKWMREEDEYIDRDNPEWYVDLTVEGDE